MRSREQRRQQLLQTADTDSSDDDYDNYEVTDHKEILPAQIGQQILYRSPAPDPGTPYPAYDT
jgi:hypothetical protein